MGATVDAKTEKTGHVRQAITVGAHQLFSDLSVAGGGDDTAPDPHALFDSALVACKSLTAHWYAKQRGIPLEAVTTHLERDGSKEREGHYALTVTMEFHGPLTDEQRAKLLDVVGRCPVHKLMTQVEVSITTTLAGP